MLYLRKALWNMYVHNLEILWSHREGKSELILYNFLPKLIHGFPVSWLKWTLHVSSERPAIKMQLFHEGRSK